MAAGDGSHAELGDLRHLAEFQALLLNSTSQALIATDATGHVTAWNRSAEELYGWSKQEALGRAVYELTVPQTSEAEAAEIMARVMRGETWSGVFPVRRRDGSEFLASVRNAPIFDSSGNLAGVIGVSEDVTEEHQREAAIQAEQERRSDWLSFTSHELRSALTSVVGYAALIHRRAQVSPPLEAIREEAGLLEAETRRMGRTLELLLKVADLDTGNLTLNAEPVRLAELVGDEVSAIAGREPHAHIDVREAGEGLAVTSDPGAIRLILRNLVENAIKYGGQPPHVEVRVRADSDERIAIAVTDNGQGISAEDQARLFERYFRSHASVGTPGLGLGLHISWRLAALLGGTLTVESASGRSSTFVLTFPSRRN